MLFVIHCLDGKDGHQKRKPIHEKHRAHLDNAAAFDVKLLTAGPLVGDDEETSIGSFFIVEAADRGKAEAFNRADPFASGVWEKIEIHGFLKRRG